jgi:hypothetical protein
MKELIWTISACLIFLSCKKNNTSPGPPPSGQSFNYLGATINDSPYNTAGTYNTSINPVIKISFSAPVNEAVTASSISMTSGNAQIPLILSYFKGDSLIAIQPSISLTHLTSYTLNVSTDLHSVSDSALKQNIHLNFVTSIDSSDKFSRISDSSLLTLIQQQTFKYFWDFGHPVSGLSRERNSSGDIVTTGGSGFGIMAILTGIKRNFISRADGLARLSTMTDFLTNKAQRYHGAFPHWMNGVTGVTIPFSTQDDGADIVETAYLMEGLLCARQYFNGADPTETALRNSINNLWDGVEWNWFRQNGQNVLYWHWSPDFAWSSNQTVSGWNEAMIVYVLAASSNIDSNRIPRIVYDNGWARNGAIKNGNTYFGIPLPLGPNLGGPLFFAHYSFLGINPNDLTDAFANYWTQDTAHTKINYSYCIDNPHHFNGYSKSCWGLTASDEQNGYDAHAPDNDDGVISPTAAISSLPYTPAESMEALRFFYYTLGDKLWGTYGFADAFNLSTIWFADSFLAIDQGPEIIMIENYRSAMFWNLFMSCPEIKKGMTDLGFSSPNLQ